MSLDKLDYVLALAEERNLTRAAKKTFISQPALTNYINRLESQLGVKLFDRFLPTLQGQMAFCTLQKPVYTRTSVAAWRKDTPHAALIREMIDLTRELLLPRLARP